MAKSEDELKAEIKRKLGLSDIARFLEYYVIQERTVSSELSERAVLSKISKRLDAAVDRNIYHFFCELGSDANLETLIAHEGDENAALDHTYDALYSALECPRTIKSEIADKFVLEREDLSNETPQGIGFYWMEFMKVLAGCRETSRSFRMHKEAENIPGLYNKSNPTVKNRLGWKMVVDNLHALSKSQLHEVYEHMYLGGELQPEKAAEVDAALRRALSSTDTLLTLINYSCADHPELGKLAATWKAKQPWIFEIDPELTRIKQLLDDKVFPNVETLKYAFSFYKHRLSPKEFEAYLSLMPILGAGGFTKCSEALREAWNGAHLIIEHKSISKRVEYFNHYYFRKNYFKESDFKKEGLPPLRPIALFSFFERLVKQSASSIEEVANEHFIQTNLLPMYVFDKFGIMPLPKVAALAKELDVKLDDPMQTTTFYQYLPELCHIFSFGRHPNREIFTYLNLSPDFERGKKCLKSLMSLRNSKCGNYPSLLDCLGEMAEKIYNASNATNPQGKLEIDITLDRTFESVELAVTAVTEFADKLAELKPLKMLMLGAKTELLERMREVACFKTPLSEKTAAIDKFISSSADFPQMLASAANPEEILTEYRGWLKAGEKAKSLDQWLQHFSTDSPHVRELFLRYNAPATYEEQVEVARTVAAAVSRKDLPCGRISVLDLALEIPFGGGKTILLPSEINLYQSKKENAKVYSLLASLYSGMHAYGGFELSVEALNELGKKRRKDKQLGSLSDYFSAFSNYELAESIFIAVEQSRLFSHLVHDFPGLEKEVQSYFEVRQRAKSRAKFSHPSEEMVFDAYQRAMVGENAVINSKYVDIVAKIQPQLESVKGAATVADSARMLNQIYITIETACKSTKKPIPPKDNKAISPRVLEEILKERMKGEVNGTQEFTVLKERGFRYKEYTSEGEAMATVHEERVPARKNPVYTEVLKRGSESVALMREQLEQLLPEDPYIERRRMHGTLDRRAFLRYKQEKAQGKAPNPRIRYQKIVEKRDIAAILALNLSRSANQPLAGTTPAAAMQRLMIYFSEASQQLGDKVGLYGFSGIGRDNVIVYTFKDIEEPFSEEVYYRMAFVMGYDHNRNGAVYRHLTHKLDQVKAEKKLFLEVCPTFIPSDLKYDGKSALDDSAHAINGMKLQEIAPLCICLSQDEASRRNLIKVFGDGHYLLTTPKDVFKDLATAYVQLTGA